MNEAAVRGLSEMEAGAVGRALDPDIGFVVADVIDVVDVGAVLCEIDVAKEVFDEVIAVEPADPPEAPKS